MSNILSNGGDVTILTRDKNKTFICMSEGTGDNLLREDIENDYVDYINWTSYRLASDAGEPFLEEFDGGMVLSKVMVEDMTTVQIIDAVWYEAGIEPGTGYIVF